VVVPLFAKKQLLLDFRKIISGDMYQYFSDISLNGKKRLGKIKTEVDAGLHNGGRN
jgi:hypothetical protein